MSVLTKTKPYLLPLALLLAVVLSWVALNKFNHANANIEAANNQATPVNVVAIEAQSIQLWKNFSARLEAVHYVELRPQVRGTIVDVHFEDGQQVEKGDVLFVIDPAPYRAAVDQAKAELNNMENEYAHSVIEFKRAENLVKTKALSKRIYDERKNASNVAKASVAEARAKLQQAQIDLDRAYVKAPISGRASQIEVTLGNLVEAGANAPILTSIVSEKNIYADFEVDEQTYVQYIRRAAKDRASEKQVPVRLRLQGDDTVYEGSIYTFDNRLDASSGTIRARALFSNTDGALLPGMFAHVELGGSVNEEKILIEERAIGTDQDRKFVYIVDEKNTVVYREIRLGESIAGKRIVITGLSDGDKVIVEGIMFIRPGMNVVPNFVNENVASVMTKNAKT